VVKTTFSRPGDSTRSTATSVFGCRSLGYTSSDRYDRDRMEPKPIRVRTKHTELTLEDLAGLLPGTGEVMASVSRVFANLWFAADGGNWDLAAFYFRRTRSLLRGLAVSRPKYAAQLEAFEADHLERLMAAIAGRDRDGFRERYQVAVAEVNRLHVETGYPYIRWRRPETPPDAGVDYAEPDSLR
jgi:hypothetical protein